jgi:hypothetical protein
MSKKILSSNRPAYTSPLEPKKFNLQGSTTGRITSTDSNITELGNKPKSAHMDRVVINGQLLGIEECKQIFTALNSDTQQQLLDYMLLIRQQQKLTSSQERKLNMWTDSLATELGRSLGQSNRMFPLPLLSGAKSMFKQVEILMKDINMQDLNTPNTKAMYNMIARVLVHQASVVSAKAKIPVSMKLVLQTTTPIAALIDNHFPGYIQSGLMKMVMTQMKNGHVEDTEDE